MYFLYQVNLLSLHNEGKMKLFDLILGNDKLYEFVKFCIVGTVCAIIDAVVFYIISIFTIYQIALVCGYLVGLLFNYIMTIYWTFKTKPSKMNFVGVVAVHLINLFAIRMGLMWLFINTFAIQFSIAYIPTVVISVIANFILIRFIINKTSKD